MAQKPAVLANKLGLTFTQPELLTRALTHRSKERDNNERLEYLGDSILGYVIAHKLYDLFPAAQEGDLSRLRANLVNQTSLAQLAREYAIGDYLILGAGELKNGGDRRDSLLSDALEAIMGAVLKDKGTEQCEKWILALFAKKLAALDLNCSSKDAKTELQELMQVQKKALPSYELVAGSPGTRLFKVECTTALWHEPSAGQGVSIKKAEQEAAKKMLQLIKLATQ